MKLLVFLTHPSSGYGGFTISVDPFFSPTILTFLQAYGAIFAVPNIRGGGEFGEEWHQGGCRERKVSYFEDLLLDRLSKILLDKLFRRLHCRYVS